MGKGDVYFLLLLFTQILNFKIKFRSNSVPLLKLTFDPVEKNVSTLDCVNGTETGMDS